MAELLYKEVVVTDGEQEHTIKITYFTGTRALALVARVLKKILPIFKALGHLDGLKFTNNKLDLSALSIGKDFFPQAIDALLVSMDEKEVVTLILDIMKNTELDGMALNRQEVFDLVFQGKPNLMMQVIKEVFIENFAPFLPKMSLSENSGNLTKA